jgi:hypothetical protein
VIPRSTVRIRLDEPSRLSGYPRAAEAESDYLDGNREYTAALLDASWSEALEIERDRLAVAARADDPEEFEDRLDGDLEDWELLGTYGLDLGVAAAVPALSASGCVTSTSCRGHAGRSGPDRYYPKVRFLSDRVRGELVSRAAASAGCGFGVDDEGVGMIWAPSVAEMMDFAAELSSCRSAFDALLPRLLA